MTNKLMGLHQHELVETARVFSGEKQKLKVVFHDGPACMSEGIVKLPATPPDVALSERGQRFDRAMVDHEAGHVAITTMGPMQKHADDNRMMSLLNGIEDVRVEKYVTDKHPGARKNLGTARDIVYEGMAEKIEQSKDARRFVGANINNAWWEKYGGWPSENRRRAFEALPEKLQDLCRKYAELADKLPSTRGSGPTEKLAQKALKELLKMGPMPPEDKPKGPGGAGGNCNGPEPEEQQPEGDEDNPQEQEQEQEGGEQGQGEGECKDEGEGDGGFNEDTECEDGDMAKRHEEVRRDESDDDTGAYGTRPGWGMEEAMSREVRLDTYEAWKDFRKGPISKTNMWSAIDSWITPLRWAEDGYYRLFEECWAKAMERVRSNVAPTQARLQEAFMAAAQRNWSGGYEYGSLNPKTLVRAYQGREGAFRQRDAGQDLDGAVTLLVDCSGSMNSNGKIQVASSMALALALVMERMNIAVEVRGFTGGEWNDDTVHMDMIFKPFDRTVMQCRDGMGVLSECGSLGNLDYVHVQSAAASLLRREEQRKMLVVLSDGDTCGGEDELHRLCDALHKRPELELLGVGIQSSSVRRYYPNYVIVNELSELSSTVAGRIAKTLTGRGLAVKEAA